MKKKAAFAFVLAAGILMGICIGVYIGIQITIHEAAKIVPLFLNITIDEKILNDAIFKYNNQIKSCWNEQLEA